MFIRLFRRFCRDSSGSTLIMVLIVFFMFTLLSMALISLSLTASTSAAAETKSQQAYLTARSANTAAIAALNTNVGLQAQIAALGVPPASLTSNLGSVGNMGTYTVTYQYTDSTKTKLKVTAKSTYNGQSQTVNSYLNLITYNASNPFNYIANYTGSTQPNTAHMIQGNISYNGDLDYNGDLSISQGGNGGTQNVNGDVFAVGKIWISGTSSAMTQLAGLDDITLSKTYYNTSNNTWYTNDSAANINCDVLTQKSLTLSAGSVIGVSGHTVNVSTNGNITLSDNSKIYGNVTCGGNVIINNGSQIIGTVRAKGTITGSVSGTKTANDSTVPTVSINYTPQPNLPKNIGYTDNNDSSITSITNSVTVTNLGGGIGKITASGILSSSAFNSYGKIIVDTGTTTNHTPDSKYAVRLIIKSSLVLNNDDLLIRGDNDVFIYLATGANLSFTNGSDLGMTTSYTSTTLDTGTGYSSKIFIIGNNQTLTLNGSSYIRAFIYIPNGILTGNSWSGGNYVGSIVITDASTLVMGGSTAFYFQAPNLTGTPLVGFAQGIYSSGQWDLKGYSNQ